MADFTINVFSTSNTVFDFAEDEFLGADLTIELDRVLAARITADDGVLDPDNLGGTAVTIIDSSDPQGEITEIRYRTLVLEQPGEEAREINVAVIARENTANYLLIPLDESGRVVEPDPADVQPGWKMGFPLNDSRAPLNIDGEITENTPPVAADDVVTVSEGQSTTYNVLDGEADGTGEDRDDDGDALTVVSASNGAPIALGTPVTISGVGTVQLDANGALTFEAAASTEALAAGEDVSAEISYTIADASGAESSATVTLTVQGENDAPTASDVAASVDEDSSVAVDLDGNVSDPDADALIIQLGTPANGTFAFDNEEYRYTPNPDFAGEDTFTYTVSDGNGGTDTGTITVTVAPVNDAPVAQGQTVSGDEDTVISGQLVATDIDDDDAVLQYFLVGNAANGNVVVNTDGSFEYTPDPDSTGRDGFTYRATDPDGAVSNLQTVFLEVNDVAEPNRDPVAVDDTITTNDGVPQSFSLISGLGGDSDPDGDDLRVESATINGTALVIGSATVVSGVGTFALSATGTLGFTPDAALGRLDDGDALSFAGAYTVIDQQGGRDNGAITVVVEGRNDAPETAPESPVIAFNTATTIDVLANDFDADAGDVLTLVSVTDPAQGTAEIVDGQVLYTPDAGTTGIDSFTYFVTDGTAQRAQTISVTVEASDNTAPIAQDGAIFLDEDTSNLGQLIYSDAETANDALTVEIVDDVENGTLVLGEEGEFTYTPDADYNGPDDFTYRVSDGALFSTVRTVDITVDPVNDLPIVPQQIFGVSENNFEYSFNLLVGVDDIDGDDLDLEDVVLTADDLRTVQGLTVDEETGDLSFDAGQFEDLAADETLALVVTYDVNDGTGITEGTTTITVQGENDAPVGNQDFASVQQGQSVTVDLVANDTDVDGDTLSLGTVAEPTQGEGSIDIVNGQLQFTAAPDFVGQVTLGYQVTDGNGGSGTSQVTFSVTDTPNADPVAADDSVSVGEDQNISFNVLSGANGASEDTDADGDPLSVVNVFDSNGSLLGTNFSFDLLDGGSVVVTSGGQVTFVTDGDFDDLDSGETAQVSFSYEVSDGTASDIGDVTITVVGSDETNTDPVASNFAVDTDEDRAVVIDFDPFISDADGDTLIVTPNSIGVTFVDGEFVYTPPEDVFGTVAFAYTVTDGNGGSDIGTVTVNIEPVNDDPTAAGASFSVAEDGSVAIDLDLLVNDVDADDLTITLGAAANGTIEFTGDAYRYTPNPDYNGPDSFEYTVTDGNGGSATATVDIDVTAVNDAPVAADDSFVIGEAGNVTGNLIDGAGGASADSDVEGDVLSVVSLFDSNGTALQVGDDNALPEGGILSVTADGTITYEPQGAFDPLGNGETGSVSFTYVISDNDQTDTGSVSIIINGSDTPNTDPVAADFTLSTDEDMAAIIDFASNVFDDDGDTLTITPGTASNGVVAVNDGAFIYTPFADVSGTDSFTYTVSDGKGGTDTGTVFVNIASVNDDPTAINGAVIVAEDGSVVLDFDPLVNDVDGNLLSFEVGEAANGSVIFNGFEFVYTPDADFSGSDSFTYTVSDVFGGQATAAIDVTVTAVNDAPVADDDVETTDADSAVTVDVLANDVDVDGDALTVSVASDALPAGQGSVSVGADGAITYDPNGAFDLLPLGQEATVRFDYTVSDGALTDTASVSIEIAGTFEDVDPVLIVDGTSGIDRLVGTDADEFVVSGAGRFDMMTGGGGSDTFVFADELFNGIREIDRILDFTAGEDGILLESDQYSVEFAASGALITAGPDQDQIFVFGNVTSISDLGIVVEEYLF